MSAIRSQQREINERIKDFLEGLKSHDRIGLIFHDDLDGFASARLFYEFLKKKNCENIHAGVLSIGKNNPFGLDGIKNAEKFIVLDLAPNLIQFELEKINKPVLYIDHHPNSENVIFGDNIIELRKDGYIPVSRTCYEILEEFVISLDWLALAGVLFDRGDKYQENIAFIRQILIKNNLRLNDFNRDVVYSITNFIIYFEDNLIKAFDMFKAINIIKDLDKIKRYSEPIEREIERFVNLYEQKGELINGIHFFYFEPKFAVKSIVTSKISFDNPDEILIFATPEENTIRLSARCQSKKRDVAELLKKLTYGFEWSTAGGHAVSAGGVIMRKDLDRFKERLSRLKL
jgi:single-stranded DNA-specific DHH superfamily exonuclease